MSPGFEGSFMGAGAKISPAAVLECKICWYEYDPARGDDTRQVLPGTAFAALPEDWSCPECGGAHEQFMVKHDPGSDRLQAQARIDRATRALVADFTEVYHAKMRDVPVINHALHVQAVGFQEWQGRLLGVLVAPWFMNLILLPGADDDWRGLKPGTREEVEFPSGTYEFLQNVRDEVGGYKACSLFSPMEDFGSQMQAVDVARAVMTALFDDQNRAETDRAAEIRAARTAELAAADPLPEADEAPTRRRLITAGLAEE